MINIVNMNKSFDERVIFKDFNLDVKDKEFVVLSGKSGSGNSVIMMTDTINPTNSRLKGFHKTFKLDDSGLSLSSFLLN